MRYSYLQDALGIPDEHELYTTATDRIPEDHNQRITNHLLSLKTARFGKQSRLSLLLGYNNNHRQELHGLDDVELDMRLETASYNLRWNTSALGKHFDLILGTQGMHQQNTNAGEERLIPDGTTTDAGAFSVLTSKFGKTQVQVGLRGDYRAVESAEYVEDMEVHFPAFENDYWSLNYSAGAVYGGKKLTLRGNLSSGFRAPNSSELLSNGVHEGTNQFVRGNTGLSSEQALQADAAVEYSMEHMRIYVNGFYGSIDNFIYLSPAGEMLDGSPVYDYLQTQVTRSGGEAGIHYHPHRPHRAHWLHLQSDFSSVFANDADGTPLPLIPGAKLSSTATAQLEQERTFKIKSIYVNHVYRFEQSRTAELEASTGAYNILNAGINLVLDSEKVPMAFRLGVNNVLNASYVDHLSRLKPWSVSNTGRNIFVGVKWMFDREAGGNVDVGRK